MGLKEERLLNMMQKQIVTMYILELQELEEELQGFLELRISGNGLKLNLFSFLILKTNQMFHTMELVILDIQQTQIFIVLS